MLVSGPRLSAALPPEQALQVAVGVLVDDLGIVAAYLHCFDGHPSEFSDSAVESGRSTPDIFLLRHDCHVFTGQRF